MIASQYGHLEIVKELIKENADIDFWLYSETDNILGYSYGIDGAGIFLNSHKIMCNIDAKLNV
jgi:hypothetical protein